MKRGELEAGTYPNVSLYESGNRIMSDLTILNGVKALLNGEVDGIDFDEYIVEYGNDDYNDNDITAIKGEIKLIGEGFNVSKSSFQSKKKRSLDKMKNQKNKGDKLLLIYNSDAVSDNYTPDKGENVYHLKVELDLKA